MSERRIRINRLRRQHQLKRDLLFGMITCLCVLTCAVLFGSSFSKATSNKDKSFKYYTSIQIEQGDTLWTIANENLSDHYQSEEEYIHEVMEMNHLKEDTLYAGDYLIIPYYSSEFKL